MGLPIAVVVDDDAQQMQEVYSTVVELGFEVRAFAAVAPAITYIESTEELVDLFVLDRKLPMREDENAVDEIGDALFRLVLQVRPDSRIIIFSGYTDFDHLQASIEGSGFVFQGANARVDRVTVLRKTQFPKFESALRELRDLIAEFERVEVVASPAPNQKNRRVLQRLAHHYGASSVSATSLAGGLTGAPVWRCRLASTQGVLASVVAKSGDRVPASGGLQDLLAREVVARRVDLVAGLMGGAVLSVLQLAGDTPVPLMELIAREDLNAARLTTQLAANLDSLARSEPRPVMLKEVVEQFMPWQRFSERLAELSLESPDQDMWLSSSSVMSHTDLHAANVLICDSSPVIIDSEENSYSSALRDPAVLLMSSWVHPDSPWITMEWPDPADLSRGLNMATLSNGCPAPAWYSAVFEWFDSRTSSPREQWAVVLAYAVRQSRFDNVRRSTPLQSRVLAVIHHALSQLIAS